MSEKRHETATLGGGCFWCLEAAFERLAGVESVVSGYSGGHVASPGYRQVCSGTTGHAEVVQVRFDPDVISYRQLLRVFFAIHDPTTKDRQGADVGSQYRSVIFYDSPEQESVARATVDALEAEGVWGKPFVTEVEPLGTFYEAEPEHQGYYDAHPEQAYCRFVVAPKVAKLRKEFADLLSPEFAR